MESTATSAGVFGQASFESSTPSSSESKSCKSSNEHPLLFNALKTSGVFGQSSTALLTPSSSSSNCSSAHPSSSTVHQEYVEGHKSISSVTLSLSESCVILLVWLSRINDELAEMGLQPASLQTEMMTMYWASSVSKELISKVVTDKSPESNTIILE